MKKSLLKKTYVKNINLVLIFATSVLYSSCDLIKTKKEVKGYYARVGENNTEAKSLFGSLGGLYPLLNFENESKVTISSFFEFTSNYKIVEDIIYISTDKGDLRLQIINSDTLIGSGFASGIYVRGNSKEEIKSLLGMSKSKPKNNIKKKDKLEIQNSKNLKNSPTLKTNNEILKEFDDLLNQFNDNFANIDFNYEDYFYKLSNYNKEIEGNSKPTKIKFDSDKFDRIKNQIYEDIKFLKSESNMSNWEIEKINNTYNISAYAGTINYTFNILVVNEKIVISSIDLYVGS